MRLSRIMLAAFVLLYTLITGMAMSDDVTRLLRVRIPNGFDLDKVMVITGQYGNGLGISMLEKVGTPGNKLGHEFILSVPKTTTKVKVLAYYPRYRLATAEVSGKTISNRMPVILSFKKLPTVPLTLRFIDSKGDPVRNYRVVIRQSLQEMPYFGYFDGAVFDYYAVPVASGTTDASGILKTKVPKLSVDPMFSSNKQSHPFSLMGGRADNKSVVLSYIPVQDSYKDPVVVKLKKL
ncbi:MAG: hypothetical protein ACYC27_09990 [Armatimonadota bacterium]